MTTIVSKVRDQIGDILILTGRDIFDFVSSTSSKIFTLSEANVTASTLKVYKNGALWASGNYTFDASTAKLTVTGTLTAGDTLEVTYSYYAKYSDNEIKGYIKASFSYLAIEKYQVYVVDEDNATVFPTPSVAEEYLIALIAVTLIKGDIISYKTPELTITFERGESKEKKIKHMVKQFQKTYGILRYIDLTSKTVINEDEEL
jgi:hypothetical protein